MAKEKILVVDDEEDILELVRFNLSREGYRVTGTLTGEDALRKVRSDSFDLIVLDLMLPGMDGLAFTKTLKNDSRLRSIPIIMLTAKGEESDIVAGLELGADDYITKPFSTEELSLRIEAILRRTMHQVCRGRRIGGQVFVLIRKIVGRLGILQRQRSEPQRNQVRQRLIRTLPRTDVHQHQRRIEEVTDRHRSDRSCRSIAGNRVPLEVDGDLRRPARGGGVHPRYR